MKKQDKLLSLLKRNRWELSDNIECEGIDFRFKVYEYDKTTAYNDCFYVLGRLDALSVSYKHLYVQKEGKYYAACIEF